MNRTKILFLITAALIFPPAAYSDDLTLRIERDLTALGYEPGPVDGEETMETVIAISKFQAENNVDVTGEVTPYLAGMLSALARDPARASVADPSPATPVRSDAELRVAQQSCLQEKMAAAQASQKKKRGLGSLMRAVSRTAGSFGNHDLSQTMGDVYNANATAEDLASAAKDLGLTEDEVAACQNPT
jgi:peptidoglycan hydrolase-like protein with peptidoglycan-binding domain